MDAYRGRKWRAGTDDHKSEGAERPKQEAPRPGFEPGTFQILITGERA